MSFRSLALLAVAVPVVASAQTPAAAPTTLPTVDQQIAAAVLPLPKDMRDGATVMGYRTADKLEVLRKGKGTMTCLALFAVREDFHVACYHNSLERFMARGRELRAQGVKGEQVDSVRFKEIKAGKLVMPKQAALYSLTGPKTAWDPATGNVKGANPLGVVYMPNATPESVGLTTNPVPGMPWMMFPGTPKAHIMIIGSMN